MRRDFRTLTPAQAAAFERTHGGHPNDDLHERRAEAADSDFVSAGDVPHDGPIMAALYRVLRGEWT